MMKAKSETRKKAHIGPCSDLVDMKVQTARIEERVEGIVNKVGVVHEDVKAIHLRLNSMDKTLMINTQSLQEHMEQTRLLREQQERFHRRLVPFEKRYERFISIVWFLTKLGTIISGVALVVYYVYDFAKDFIPKFFQP